MAASSRADAAVVDSIGEVLEEHAADRIGLVVWTKLHRKGPIREQAPERTGEPTFDFAIITWSRLGPDYRVDRKR